jgi:hypothetical protein
VRRRKMTGSKKRRTRKGRIREGIKGEVEEKELQ